MGTLDRSLFQKVLQPKVCGALNLHFGTLHHQTLDYFVCYSSISSFIGNAAQANYAAANLLLPTQYWTCQSQSIKWGPLKLGQLMDKVFLETKGLMIMECVRDSQRTGELPVRLLSPAGGLQIKFQEPKEPCPLSKCLKFACLL